MPLPPPPPPPLLLLPLVVVWLPRLRPLLVLPLPLLLLLLLRGRVRKAGLHLLDDGRSDVVTSGGCRCAHALRLHCSSRMVGQEHGHS